MTVDDVVQCNSERFAGKSLSGVVITRWRLPLDHEWQEEQEGQQFPHGAKVSGRESGPEKKREAEASLSIQFGCVHFTLFTIAVKAAASAKAISAKALRSSSTFAIFSLFMSTL